MSSNLAIGRVSGNRSGMLALIATLAGIVVFFLLLDPSIINPFRVDWLANGDPAQSYLTWSFFRHEPWGWPLGVTHTMGMEQASSIVFSDSIPLLAITFKLLDPWLPEKFQYHGIWLCACYALQGYFSYRLLALFTSRRLVLAIGVLLFLLSPIMLFRSQAHLALTAHWFVVAALYLYYAPAGSRRVVHWLALLWLVPLVHAYLTLMVYSIWAAYVLRFGILDRQWSIRRMATWVLLSISGTLLMMWAAGYFLDMSVSGGGFGFYSLNALAPFTEIGATPFLRDAPAGATAGQYEGFNYLGLGVLLALSAGCLRALITYGCHKHAAPRGWLASPDTALIFSCAGLCALALSNQVTFGSHILFVIPMSAHLESAANVFRASGRLFWPVYYLLILASIRSALQFGRPVCAALLVVVIVAQLASLFPLLHAIRVFSSSNAAESKFPVFPAAFWKQARMRYSEIYVIPGQYKENEHLPYETLAGTYGFSIDTAYFARLPSARVQEPRGRRHDQFYHGVLDSHGMYLIQSSATDKFNSVQQLFPPSTGIGVIDGFTVVAPKWLDGKRESDLHAPVSHDFPAAALGAHYSFGSGGTGLPYMLTGWSEPGDEGTWSEGSSAMLALHLPPHSGGVTLVLSAEPYLPARFPRLDVDVQIDGHVLAHWKFERDKPVPDTRLFIPAALRPANGNVALTLIFNQARSPLQSGESADSRQLALLIRTVSILQE